MSVQEKLPLDKELLSSDDLAVGRLLKGLERVGAPADFDLKVRARIARGRKDAAAVRRFPVFARYAAGICALLVVAGIGGFLFLSRPGSVEELPLASKALETQRPSVETISNSVPPTQVEPNDERSSINPSVPNITTRGPAKDNEKLVAELPSNRSREDKDVGSSRIEATREGIRVFPKGVDPNSAKIVKPKDFDNSHQTPASEVLTLLGVGASFTDGTWRVDTVKGSTAAERVGVKPGDLIEAINDQVLREKTSFSGSFSVKSLRVKRDGQLLNISLVNK